MEHARIEQYVTDLLTVTGLEPGGKEQSLWEALHHLCMAAALRDLMTMDEKELLKPFIKKLQFFFSTRFDLRERKGKQKKESFPPNPLIKKKQEKGKEERNTDTADGGFSGCSSDDDEPAGEAKKPVGKVRLKGHQNLSAGLRARLEAFAAEVRAYDGVYTREALNDFFNYWSEENKSTGKMRFEEQRTWNLSKRLKRWVNKTFYVSDTAAAIRMKRLKKEQEKEARQQQTASEIAHERRQADQQREADTEQARKEAGGLADTISKNPTGILAQVQRDRQKREALKTGDKQGAGGKTEKKQQSV